MWLCVYIGNIKCVCVFLCVQNKSNQNLMSNDWIECNEM